MEIEKAFEQIVRAEAGFQGNGDDEIAKTVADIDLAKQGLQEALMPVLGNVKLEVVFLGGRIAFHITQV